MKIYGKVDVYMEKTNGNIYIYIYSFYFYK